ncbi:MAG: CSLREA domain-containing protein [Betaproteobacteria bacterium]|nr:MAG: CSLREA domain-containing protein [Betaproteobacteria bacterium]
MHNVTESPNARSGIPMPQRWLAAAKRALLALATLGVAPALWAATITVNSTADTAANDGLCTLREAITAANNNAASGGLVGECAAGSGADTIAFNIAGGGTLLIAPATPLPTILSPIRINGYTQPGASANTNGPLLGSNAVIRIEIDNGAIANTPTLYVAGGAAAGSIIEGLALSRSTVFGGNAASAIQIESTSNVWVRGNFIGTDATGLTVKSAHSRGIFITSGSTGTTGVIVGSDTAALTPAYVNVFNLGVIDASNAANLTVRGNLVGTKPDGNTVFAATLTQFGVYLTTLSGNSLVADNVVAATNTAIFVGGGSNGVVIERNLLGLGVDGVTLLPAGTFGGISVLSNTQPTTQNTISFNTLTNLKSAGVSVTKNNAVDIIRGVVISRNVIYNTTGIGIDLSNTSSEDGVTANDPLDIDQGANNLQNYPVLSAATNTAGIISVPYTINTQINSSQTIEFFQTTTCHSSGFGGGEVYLGSAVANTNGTGITGATPTFASTLTSGFITAVAMNFSNGSSEFSACVPLSAASTDGLLSVTKTGAGAGTVIGNGIDCGADCTETLTNGTVVALTASADVGSTFVAWSGGCTGSGACSATVNGITNVNALFSRNVVPFVVTKSGTGTGTVTGVGIDCGADCSEPYAPGVLVTLTASATPGSTFIGWSGGTCTGTGNCVFTMPVRDVSLPPPPLVNAQFDVIVVPNFLLTVTKSGSGTGDVTGSGIACGADCNESLAPSTMVTLTAAPLAGSTFAGWTGGGCSGTGTCIVTMTVALTVNAQFTLAPPPPPPTAVSVPTLHPLMLSMLSLILVLTAGAVRRTR